MELKDWITIKYVEWRGDKVGHDSTVSLFSEYIGVSQPVMSGWMNGNYAPHRGNVDRLAAKLGYEIYDVLNIPQDERPVRADLREAIRQVPPENQDELLKLIEEYLRLHGWERIV